MKKLILAAALAVVAAPVLAQSAAPAPATVVSAEQVARIGATARAAQAAANPARPNMSAAIIAAPPYALNLEHRVGPQAASIHTNEAELLIVLEGSGTVTTGGTLVGAGAPSGGNIIGTGITGGETRRIVKGDFIMVPEGVAHTLSVDPAAPLVMASLHLPRNGRFAPPAAGGRGGAPKLFHAAADLPGMIERAKAAAATSARFFGGDTILSLPPYRVGLEYRTAKGIASVHKQNSEFMFVLEGEGILETGGTVVNPRDTGANIDGDAQTGSIHNRMKKGDFIFVPAGLPHLARTDGVFVLATMHVDGEAK